MHSDLHKKYTISITEDSVHYDIEWWQISNDTDRLEFEEGGKRIITTKRYTIIEQ